MANDDNSETIAEPAKKTDLVTTGLMSAAALSAVAGFGMLFSIWWQSGISNEYEKLRVASQEFVAGRFIIAGNLAEQVELEPLSKDEAADDSVTPTPNEEADPAVSVKALPPDPVTPEEQAARDARAERRNWIRLREFLVGAGKADKANQTENVRERRRLLYEAVPHLIASRNEGFPSGRQADGHRILGEAQFGLGRFDEASEALTTAIEQDPTQRHELSPMLAEAELKSSSASDKSLRTIETYLQDTTLRPQQRWKGELIRIRALIAQKRWDDADNAAKRARQIQPDVGISDMQLNNDFQDEVSLLESVANVQWALDRWKRGQLIGNVDPSRIANELAPTTRQLNELQREERTSPRIASQARLWLARAKLAQGLDESALTLFTAVRQQRPFGAESIVAGLEEIELLARQGLGKDVLQTTRYIVHEIGDPSGFYPGQITLKEFQQRMVDVLDQLRRRGRYREAIDATRSLPPLFDVSSALRQEGIGYREWAAAEIASGTDVDGQISRGSRQIGRSYYIAAGDAFAKAAELLFDTEDYLSAQWAAIEAYQLGKNFRRSINLLETYLRYEDRIRKPRGLVAYGRALLAEGESAKALASLKSCVAEYPNDPLKYDARLLAALAHAETGDLETARELLTDNLQDGALTPQSPAWRDSLFTMAETLYERGNRDYLIAEQMPNTERIAALRENQATLEEAIKFLDEAVTRYWPAPRAESAKYMSARAHVLSSRWPRIEARSPDILDTARRTLRAQSDRQLQIALDGFTMVRGHLSRREEERRLPDRDRNMLRNCHIAEADVLREMNRLEDAAKAYQTAELRYMNEPPALEAILGRANCLKGLGRPREADLLIRQASVVLDRIPNDWNGKFAETTRYNRQGWERLLGWMNGRGGGV